MSTSTGATGRSGSGSSGGRASGGRSGGGSGPSGASGAGASTGLFSAGGTAAGATSPGLSGAGLPSAKLGRSESVDTTAGHTLSGVFDRLARLDPRDAISEATGWRPSFPAMIGLLMGSGLVVFVLASSAMLFGGRGRRRTA